MFERLASLFKGSSSKIPISREDEMNKKLYERFSICYKCKNMKPYKDFRKYYGYCIAFDEDKSIEGSTLMCGSLSNRRGKELEIYDDYIKRESRGTEKERREKTRDEELREYIENVRSGKIKHDSRQEWIHCKWCGRKTPEANKICGWCGEDIQ